MSYNKLGFTSGQTLKAEHLNYIEEGIANAGGVTSWNDLEDKPFFSEMVEGAVTFDGDLTGKEYVDMGNGALVVKISDAPVMMEELVGSTVIIKHNMEGTDAITELTITEDIVMRQDVSDVDYMLGVTMGDMPAVLVFHGDVSAAMGAPVTEGVYFFYLSENGNYLYAHSLSCLEGMQEVVHKIDEKYLPAVGLKAKEVQQMIDKAIGSAIGGSY